MITQLQEIFLIFFSSLFGLCFGSFITMASYRIPKGEEIVRKASHCPNCNHKLGFLDLFPVFSWIYNSGQCKYCKIKISFRYPAIEIITAVLFVAAYIKLGLAIHTLIFWLIIMFLMMICVMEVENKKNNLKILILLLILVSVFVFLQNSYSYKCWALSMILGSFSLFLDKAGNKIKSSLMFELIIMSILFGLPMSFLVDKDIYVSISMCASVVFLALLLDSLCNSWVAFSKRCSEDETFNQIFLKSNSKTSYNTILVISLAFLINQIYFVYYLLTISCLLLFNKVYKRNKFFITQLIFVSLIFVFIF